LRAEGLEGIAEAVLYFYFRTFAGREETKLVIVQLYRPMRDSCQKIFRSNRLFEFCVARIASMTVRMMDAFGVGMFTQARCLTPMIEESLDADKIFRRLWLGGSFFFELRLGVAAVCVGTEKCCQSQR